MLGSLLRAHRERRCLLKVALSSKRQRNDCSNANFDNVTYTASTTCTSRMLVLGAAASMVLGAGSAFLTTASTESTEEDDHTFTSRTLPRPRMALCHGAPPPPSRPSPPCKSQRERLSDYLSSLNNNQEANEQGKKDSDDTRDLSLLLPEYTSAQVAEHDGSTSTTTTVNNSSRIWMSYGGFVYDVTDFIPMHPGGTERISRAAGAAMEPYWFLHQQHYETQLPMDILQTLVVGRLAQADQDKIDEQVLELQNEMNRFRLELDFEKCSSRGSSTRRTLSLHDLKELPKTDLITQVGCPQKSTSRSRSTATSLFGGVLLKDLLLLLLPPPLGIVDETDDSSSDTAVIHSNLVVVFHAMDGETVTVEATTMSTDSSSSALHNWRDDILIAYEENGKPLTHQRGFPLRVIIPAAAAAAAAGASANSRQRVVKWVKRIEVRFN
jgi:cytochrome b involved in lipid metabolism